MLNVLELLYRIVHFNFINSLQLLRYDSYFSVIMSTVKRIKRSSGAYVGSQRPRCVLAFLSSGSTYCIARPYRLR